MQKINALLSGMLCFLPAMTASAAQFSTNYGDIATIRAYSQSEWAEQPTFIQLEGQPVIGACASQDFGKGTLNYFAIMPEDSHLVSIALMAYSSGQSVKITSNDDDATKFGSVCRVRYIDLNK